LVKVWVAGPSGSGSFLRQLPWAYITARLQCVLHPHPRLEHALQATCHITHFKIFERIYLRRQWWRPSRYSCGVRQSVRCWVEAEERRVLSSDASFVYECLQESQRTQSLYPKCKLLFCMLPSRMH